MQKIKLNHMIILMIGLATLLVINTMGILAYRDTILSAETYKNTMLNFIVKYDTLLDNLSSDANLFITTNDESHRTSFIVQKYEFTNSDRIILSHQTFTENQATSEIREIMSENGFTLSAQAGYLGFSHQEKQLYQEFLNAYHKVIEQLTSAVEQRDAALLNKTSFYEDLNRQDVLMDALSKKYIQRLNEGEDKVLRGQKILDVFLILLYLSFLASCTLTFLVLVRENRRQSYLRQFYNTVVENVNVGIAVLNQDEHFEYMNSAYKEILGITRAHGPEPYLREVLAPNVADTVKRLVSSAEKGSGMEALYIGNTLKSISYDYFTIYLSSGDKKTVHLIQDNSEAENLHAQLKKQLKEIEYYSKAKDTLIANISHEIKTPINAILGMVHFLKDTRLSKNQKDLVRKIETSSDILLTIISDVLDLSRIKNNSLTLYPSDFSLNAVLKNVEDMFSSQLAGKGLAWRTHYAFDPELCLHLDKTRFVQVLVNLVNNACKFTDQGYVKLSVETLYDEGSSVRLQVCVEDTGIGIEEQDMSKLFHEFEQLENHLTKQHQGTGLGLFICKSIIESMNGRMWAQSVKGRGSKFFFILNAEKAFHAAPINTSGNASGAVPIPMDGGGGRALVVEDTEINVEVAVKLLNDVNVICDTAPDGLAAIQLCKKYGDGYYKVILMDIHMPVMDGYTAALIIRNDFNFKTPIVALTASDIDNSTREEYAGVIDEFILKPFKVSAFYKTLAPYFTPGTSMMKKNITSPKLANNLVKILDAFHQSEEESLADEVIDPLFGKEEAIKNLGGAESIYYKHINKFKDSYANSAEHVKELLAEDNFDEARRLIHSIKGLGGTLGLWDVQSAAAALEHAILMGKGYDLTVEMEDFTEALEMAIAFCNTQARQNPMDL